MNIEINAGQIGQVINAKKARIEGKNVQLPADAASAAEPASPGAQEERSGSGQASSQTARHRVFISYSHEDRPWVQRLEKVLAPLLRARSISVWWDRQIKPSDRWKEEIDSALASARVAVLLVSPNFLQSEFIANCELPHLLEAAGRKELKLLWVLVQNCMYKHTALRDYQAAHDVSRPLNALSEPERDDIFVALGELLADAAGGQ